MITQLIKVTKSDFSEVIYTLKIKTITMVDKASGKILASIQEAIRRDSKLLPTFIQERSTTHKMCAEIAEGCVLQLSKLIYSEYLNKRQINFLTSQITNGINDMIEIDPGVAILYFEWFQEMLQAYKELCLVNELFESVVNIDKFIEEINKPA